MPIQKAPLSKTPLEKMTELTRRLVAEYVIALSRPPLVGGHGAAGFSVAPVPQ